jgi:hypothetical protein
VARAAGIYERELRELLRGETGALRKYAHRLPPVDRGEVVVSGPRPFPVVKSSTEATIRFSAASGRANAQLVAHREAVARVGLLVVYAYRRVGGVDRDTWRLFATGGEKSEGSLRLLRRFLPPVAMTPEGNGVLRWDDGKPLLDFLRQVSFLTERTPAVHAP